MINNKMLKEPLFLDFNSSGVLNRAEQAKREKCKVLTKANLEDYQLLNKDTLSNDDSNEEREKQVDKEREAISSTDSSSTNNDDSNAGFVNCMRNLRFNFSCLLGCIDE